MTSTRLGRTVALVALGLTLATTAQANGYTDYIIGIQTCLTAMGYTPGPIDGVQGRQTLLAWNRWATARLGPHWPDVPVDTTAGVFIAECLQAGAAREAKRLPLYQR